MTEIQGVAGIVRVNVKKLRSFPVPPAGKYKVTLKTGKVQDFKNAEGGDRQRLVVPFHFDSVVDGDEKCQSWEGKDGQIRLDIPHEDDTGPRGDKRMFSALYYLTTGGYAPVDEEWSEFDSRQLDGIEVEMSVRNYVSPTTGDDQAAYTLLVPTRAQAEREAEGRGGKGDGKGGGSARGGAKGGAKGGADGRSGRR